MIGKFFNLTIKTKIIAIFLTVLVMATSVVVVVRANQIQAQTNMLITERLQSNANMTFGIFETVQTYTVWMMQIAANYAKYGLTTDSNMTRDLSYIFAGMNREIDGIHAYENIIVFDMDFNIVAVANPTGDTVDLSMFYAEHGERMTDVWSSPSFINPASGKLQLLFTQPVTDNGQTIGYVGVIGNAEMLKHFLRDFMQVYDSFVNVVDGSGNIFFSNRPEAYMGRHVDDLGVYEAFGEIPKNTLFEHNSALTGIDKIAYITHDPQLNWTIVSFFDADAVEDASWIIFVSLAPTIAGLIIAGAFVVFIIHRSLKPLQALAVSARAVAKGNMAVRFKVDNIDEIGQVSSSFLEIVTALNILGNNFKNAEKAMKRNDTEYNLSDSRLGGIFDEMLDSANNIIKNIQDSMLKAQQASEAKSDFLATMSHEIRTPMNAILGITQIQLQKDTLADEDASAFQKIYSSGSTLLGIINDILDMSKIESGKLELSPIEYDMPSLINDTVQLNIVRIGSKPIEFILDPDENLPSTLYGDELRIKQVLNNLLSNAIKYTDEGHVKFGITAFPQGEHTLLQFAVEDTGQGMKPEDLENLFSAYSRFNLDDNRTVEGAGIGMSIADNLIKMMDGTIDVVSEFGKGSTFTVTIKQKTVDSPPIGAALAKQLCNFSFLKSKEHTQVVYEPMPYGSVLVVDDVETNLFVALGLLSPYQISIETANSGFVALEKVGEGKAYDIIFMDHMMPKMDGIETTQKLRAMGYTGLIIALTANALVGNDEMFRSKGFDGFISKPVDIRQLDRVMVRCIRDRHPEEAAKYKDKAVVQAVTEAEQINPLIISAFLRDAKSAASTIRETAENGDMLLFTTTAHAMKAALGNIREHEASKMAAALEDAGNKNDIAFISENADALVQKLEEIILNLSPQEASKNELDIDEEDEDTAFLAEQMSIINSACDDYDDTTAYEAIGRLKEKSWSSQTSAAIEKINNTIMLQSDFEKAAELALMYMDKK